MRSLTLHNDVQLQAADACPVCNKTLPWPDPRKYRVHEDEFDRAANAVRTCSAHAVALSPEQHTLH